MVFAKKVKEHRIAFANKRKVMLKKGFSEAEIFDHDRLKEVYNLEPGDFIDLKALAGDASDNIPGVPGIGPKTATDLIHKFDTLEKLYEQIAKLLNCSIAGLSKQQFNNETITTIAKQMEIRPRILELLIKNCEQAFMSQGLATIRRDAPVECDLESARWGQYDREGLRKLFEELEFKSLLRRFSKDWEEDKAQSLDSPPTGEAGKAKINPKDEKAEKPKEVTEEQKKKDEQLRLEL